jgi:methyltransferase (TIGR00027 family)
MNRQRWRGWRHHLRARPSKTSQAVAVVRAELQRPHTQDGDATAQARLCAGMPAVRALPQRAHLAARTQFFDEQVLAALDGGIRQVVILGAGYDDRALRFRAPGSAYFELDHPVTQADKRRRLLRMGADLGGLTLAGADFRYDDVGAVLAAAGHDVRQASLFICEGLLVYLDQEAFVGLLSALRSRAAPGSRLAVSLAIHPDGLDSDVVVAQANARRPNGAAEPWRTILPAAAQLRLIGRAGWSPGEPVSDAEFGSGAPGRSVLVTAGPGRTDLARPPTAQAAGLRAARFRALITARSDARTIDSLIPTPHSTRSPTSISRYAAASASRPAVSACSA